MIVSAQPHAVRRHKDEPGFERRQSDDCGNDHSLPSCVQDSPEGLTASHLEGLTVQQMLDLVGSPCVG